MSGQLKGLVLGSGFAGQGHAEAMRSCGIEVVGMVSRTAEVVDRVAAEMVIPYSSTDWVDGSQRAGARYCCDRDTGWSSFRADHWKRWIGVATCFATSR